MTTHTLGMPAELKHWLERTLPLQRHIYPPFVSVTARDAAERRCPAWAADHYEIHAFYTTSDLRSLGALESALQAVPGAYLTTQVHRSAAHAVFTNREWPRPLGAGRRDRDSLRIQVMALIRDEPRPSSPSASREN